MKNLLLVILFVSVYSSCDYNHDKKVLNIRDMTCDDSTKITCTIKEPECNNGYITAIQNNCWVCANSETCVAQRDLHCDDGTTPTCDMIPPSCDENEILAYQNNCYTCVNPNTCQSSEITTCNTDLDCLAEQYCDPCGTSSCPDCDDCIAACVSHSCNTQPDNELLCNELRPDCGLGNVAVIENGCWVCVKLETCEVSRDSHCDDGTEPLCDMMPPTCNEDEILAYQNNCYTCVNPATCVPWGVPQCKKDIDCTSDKYCDNCGSSSCPGCLDCVAACMPHYCNTQPDDELLCNELRLDCGLGNVAVIENGCWVCVTLGDCSSVSD